MTALLTELSHQLHQQATVLTKLPASPDVLKAQQSLLKMQSLMPRFQSSVDALAHERQALHALYEVGQSVNSTLELEEVLNQVMDRIIQLTGAERSFLMLKDEDTGEMEVRVARNVDRAVMTQADFAVSRTIVQQVAAEGQIHCDDQRAGRSAFCRAGERGGVLAAQHPVRAADRARSSDGRDLRRQSHPHRVVRR